MDKKDIYRYLSEHGIEIEITEHKAVFNMEEVNDIELPYPEMEAKNLFVCDDKKTSYYLITVKGDKKVNLKEFRKKYGLRSLSFASKEALMDIMGLQEGSVTPLGLLNDNECKVHFFLDIEFANTLIGVHPNDNTATVWMKAKDLVSLIKEHGNKVDIVEIV